MEQVEHIKLEMEMVVPDFVLPSLDGKTVSPRQYKQRENLVIAYLDLNGCDECASFLRDLADNYHLYRSDEAEILAVFPQPLAELRSEVGIQGLPFPLLSDEHGLVRGAYFDGMAGGAAAGVFITDRYGALRSVMIAQEGRDLPSQQSILDWLNLIEMECPECGD
jgi:peroxiredoxin